ncbi:hypothetical protein [Streptomyces cavernicola]|uniref:DUF4239 domain-containing protein n=1 Tax=Streptomyces cavernicola TaxID=3043613 RepID=A0ABT6SII6_9ACTN|nr:hypothetical protein [Streptomyces sp. B-S-A6]MDI3407694.1 hypothetical protein [Streptomyces sp. B-S-A6]
MTRVEWGAIALLAWAVSLQLLLMTASAQRRGKKTHLESLLWKRACAGAERRRTKLEEDVRESDLATPLAPETLNYLQREDVLFQASGEALTVKMITTTFLALHAGGAAVAVWLDGDGDWREPSMFSSILIPLGITVWLNILAMGPGMRRWTTDTLTSTGRRSYEALLKPFETSGPEPLGDAPFHARHIPAVRALEDFARALERYAVERALPDGSSPMPQVVARYTAAAAHVRDLRDGVELDRVDGRKRALLEVERLLKVLAGPRLLDLAPSVADADSMLTRHHARRAWRRQTLVLVVFTLGLASVVGALAVSESAIGAAVAAVAATFLVASWAKYFGLPTGNDGGQERPG